MRAISASVAALLLLVAAGVAQQPLRLGFELERGGRLEEAAEIYRGILEADAANIGALLGLERTLAPLGRLDSLLPLARRAAAASPDAVVIRALEIRLWVTLEEADSAAAAARRWAARVPGDETPFREWARAHLARGNLVSARDVLEEGRVALGGPPVLSPEMGQVATMLGDWPTAAREWRAAVAAQPAMAATAEGNLGLVPPEARSLVLGELTTGAPPAGYRLAGDLLVTWGRAEEGWVVLSGALPEAATERTVWLRHFADRARLDRTREGQRSLGFALEELAEVISPREAARYLGEAARAFSAVGETDAARRVIERITALGPASRETAAGVQATLISIALDEDRLDDAEEGFAEWRARLSDQERADLLDRIAWARIREGRVHRVAPLVGDDSSAVALALRGWTALFHGALAEAVFYFRAAGPHADGRATERTRMLALLQPITRDSLPALGEALLKLARGDTADATVRLEKVADRLPADGGRAGVLVLSADLHASQGRDERAERVYRAILEAGGNAAAVPAAELGLARVLLNRGAREEAIGHLEHLILTYPRSALVPQARRELDRARGLIPSSS